MSGEKEQKKTRSKKTILSINGISMTYEQLKKAREELGSLAAMSQKYGFSHSGLRAYFAKMERLEKSGEYLPGATHTKSTAKKPRPSLPVPEMQVLQGLGETVRRMRLAKGLSLREMGEIGGLSPSYINRIESGDRGAPTGAVLAKIGKVLDITYTDMLKMAGKAEELYVTKQGDDTQALEAFLHSARVTIDGQILSTQSKKMLAEIVYKIEDCDWDNVTKLSDSLSIIGLIDAYKASR